MRGYSNFYDSNCWFIYRADTNKDGFLDENELEFWIAKKVKEHFQKAVHENIYIFTALDKDHNGMLL